MDLVVHQMVELQEVNPSDCDVVIELLARTAVVHLTLSIFAQACLAQSIADRCLVCAIKDRCSDLPTKSLSRVTQVDFTHLTDIHTGRNAQRIKHDIQRSTVRQIRHVFPRQNTRYNTLVSVTAGHLIAYGDLALLRDINAYDLVYAGIHLIARFACEHLDIHNDAALAVRNFERCVAHFARLFAEDCAQQPFFGREVGFALRCHFSDQNIARSDFSTDHDDAAFVKILQRVLTDTGDVTGDLLGPELGVTRFGLVFFDMYGCVYILLHQTLADQDGVLVVVAFPVHIADQDILAE